MDDRTIDKAPLSLKAQRARRQRINRIKTGIVLFVALWLIVSMVLNIVLMVRVSSLQKQIDVIVEKTLQNTSYTVEPNQDLSKSRIEGSAEVTDQAQADMKTDNAMTDTTDTQTTSEPETDQKNNSESIDVFSSDWDVRDCITGSNIRSSEDPMTVFLTFDDGPSENTPEILEILKRHNVKATFFVTGREGEHAREWYNQIVTDGHTLAMHSYTHKYSSIYDSLEAFQADFTKLHDYLKEVTGIDSRFFRFPGGSSNQVSNTDMNEFIDYLGEQGITYYDWNVVCGDATSQIYTADEMVQNVMTDVAKFRYSVVLMHDAANKDTTVEALETLLQMLESMDAEILPITSDSPVIHHTIS